MTGVGNSGACFERKVGADSVFGMEDDMKKKPDAGKDEKVSFDEYLALQNELDETRKKYGVEVKEGRISRAISNFFDK